MGRRVGDRGGSAYGGHDRGGSAYGRGLRTAGRLGAFGLAAAAAAASGLASFGSLALALALAATAVIVVIVVVVVEMTVIAVVSVHIRSKVLVDDGVVPQAGVEFSIISAVAVAVSVAWNSSLLVVKIVDEFCGLRFVIPVATLQCATSAIETTLGSKVSQSDLVVVALIGGILQTIGERKTQNTASA